MTEVRNRSEGTLYWVAASGSGIGWVTASGASGKIFAYVRDNTHTSGRTIQTVSDRGIPIHHKFVSKEPVQVSYTVAWGVTANYPDFPALTAQGSTVPMILIEYKATATEEGKAVYFQYQGCAHNSLAWAEGDTENTQQFAFVALGMNGPTASGYLG